MNIYTILMSEHKRSSFFPKLSRDNGKGNQRESRLGRSLDYRQYLKTHHRSFQLEHTPVPNPTTTFKQHKTPVRKLATTVNNLSQHTPISQIGEYQQISELGKGGFAQVFQVYSGDGSKYAMKQYELEHALGCFRNECTVGQYFFEGARIKEQFAKQRGSKNIIRFVEKFMKGKRGYIIQEIGGNSLSKLSSELQGVFHRGERVYEVKFSSFYWGLLREGGLKQILLGIGEGMGLLNRHGFIHCDLKPENILVREGEEGKLLAQIIDFGSSFRLEMGLPKITITPEYMPPELLIALQTDGEVPDLSKVDIWSLGCVLLEIVTGIPLWFRYKCKLQIRGKSILQLGLFALTNREYSKIVRRQKQMCLNLDKIVFVDTGFEPYRAVLKKTLVFSQKKRATHAQLIYELKAITCKT